MWNKKKLEKQILFIKKNKYNFIFCNYIKRKNQKEKKIICNEKFLDYKKLLKSCDIGLSTVMIKSSLLKKNLFPSLKTKEDYVLWLKITKKNIRAYNMSETLVVWNSVKNSLSSNIIQKIKDGFLVYKKYQGFNLLKSIYYLTLLSVNSLKKI